REVDHQTALGDGETGDVVSAALDRELEPVLTREVDGLDDVLGGARTDDRGRALVDQTVVDAPRLVVAGVAGLQNLRGELLETGQLRTGCGHALPPPRRTTAASLARGRRRLQLARLV